MATINEKMAREIAANNGIYPGDPQCFAVFKYFNHNFQKECFACAYDLNDFSRYAAEFKILEVLFAKDDKTVAAVIELYEVDDGAH